jgi:hypothetical protein
MTQSPDAELSVLNECRELLGTLQADESARVARYLAERFDPSARSDASTRNNAKKGARKARSLGPRLPTRQGADVPDIARLVNRFKVSENYTALSGVVLDQADLLNRVLVALAVYRQDLGDAAGMTSGEIAQFYLQLGVKIGVPNISNTLSGRAKQFVISDSVRKKGVIMRYRLSHHGIQRVAALGVETARA